MPGFKIAEVFAELTLQGEGVFNKKIDGILTSLQRVGTGFSQLQTIANTFLLGLGAAGTFAFKQYIDMAHGNDMLKASLKATGQEVDRNYQKIDQFASEFERGTTQDADSIKKLASQLINMGASVKNVTSIIQLGTGLGRALFGGDSTEGARAFLLAQQGEFRELSRLIPSIKHAKNETQAYAMVVKIATNGLKEEVAHANTLEGSLTRLWNTVQDTSKVFGQLLVPSVTKAVEGLERFLNIAQALSLPQKELVLQALGVTAALAGIVTIGPKIYAVVDGFMNIFFGAARTILSFGQVLISIVTGPVGGFLIGVGLIATALAYLEGAGDTAAERILSGFGEMAQGLDLLLGSFTAFKAGLNIIWIAVTNFLVDTWWAAFDKMGEVWENLKAGARTAAVVIQSTWEKTTDAVAQSTANSQMMINRILQFWKDVPRMGFGKANEIYQKGLKDDEGYLDKQVKDKQIEDEKKFNNELIQIDKDLGNQLKYNKAQVDAERAAQNKKYQEDTDAQIKKISESPRLSDGIKILMEKIKQGSGIKDLLKDFQNLVDQWHAIDTNKPTNVMSGDRSIPQMNVPPRDLHFTSLEDAFKKNLATILLGEDFKKSEQAEAKRAREEAAKVRRQLVQKVAYIADHLDSLGGMAA